MSEFSVPSHVARLTRTATSIFLLTSRRTGVCWTTRRSLSILKSCLGARSMSSPKAGFTGYPGGGSSRRHGRCEEGFSRLSRPYPRVHPEDRAVHDRREKPIPERCYGQGCSCT